MNSENSEQRKPVPLDCALGVVLAMLMLAGCGSSKQVDATIVKVLDDKSKMGCVGTDKRTVIRTSEGFTANICGEYGSPGDKVRGYWREGAWDASQNGFRFNP